MTALVIIEAVVIAILVVLVAGLLRSHADILRILHDAGLAEDDGHQHAGADSSSGVTSPVSFTTQPGVPQPRDAQVMEAAEAHDISGSNVDGGAVRVAVTGTRHNTLVAFLSSGCLTCRDFWETFAGDLELPGENTRLVIVTQGPESESPSSVKALAPAHITTLMSSQAWADYKIPVSPYFLLVEGHSGDIIGEGAANTWDSVSNLLGKALADTGRTPLGTTTTASRANGQVREADTDAALLAAGIEPGDPSLYPTPHPTHDLPNADR